MPKKMNLVILLAVVAIGGYIIVSSMGTATVTCEVCMEFKGREACRTARGADRDEAIITARNGACSEIVNGRTENILCGNEAPKMLSCSE